MTCTNKEEHDGDTECSETGHIFLYNLLYIPVYTY